MSTLELERTDYYALLGVQRTASVDAIKQAFHGFALRYHPDRHAASREQAQEAARVYRKGAEAYRVLTDPEARRAYDQSAGFAGEAAPAPRAPRVPGSPIQVRAFQARPFVMKALEAERAGNLQAARLNFQIALQHEGDGNGALEAALSDVEAKLKKK